MSCKETPATSGEVATPSSIWPEGLCHRRTFRDIVLEYPHYLSTLTRDASLCTCQMPKPSILRIDSVQCPDMSDGAHHATNLITWIPTATFASAQELGTEWRLSDSEDDFGKATSRYSFKALTLPMHIDNWPDDWREALSSAYQTILDGILATGMTEIALVRQCSRSIESVMMSSSEQPNLIVGKRVHYLDPELKTWDRLKLSLEPLNNDIIESTLGRSIESCREGPYDKFMRVKDGWDAAHINYYRTTSSSWENRSPNIRFFNDVEDFSRLAIEDPTSLRIGVQSLLDFVLNRLYITLLGVQQGLYVDADPIRTAEVMLALRELMVKSSSKSLLAGLAGLFNSAKPIEVPGLAIAKWESPKSFGDDFAELLDDAAYMDYSHASRDLVVSGASSQSMYALRRYANRILRKRKWRRVLKLTEVVVSLLPTGLPAKALKQVQGAVKADSTVGFCGVITSKLGRYSRPQSQARD